MADEHIAAAKVTGRIQIAIPKEVQKRLGGLKSGDYVLFYEERGRVYMKRGTLQPLERRP